MGRFVAALITLSLLLWPRVTEACSCVPLVLSRTFYPDDGARGVPIDAPVRVFLSGFAPELRQALKKELRLRVAGGAVVPTKAKVVATRIDLVPDAPLAPRRRYSIEQLVAFDEKGNRVTDTQRRQHAADHAYAGVPKAIHLAWFEVASFTTGDGPGARALPTPRVTGAELQRRQGGGDCGPANTLRMELEPVALPELYVYELEVRGQGVVATVPAHHRERIAAGNSLCAYDKVWLRAAHRPFQARVVLRGPSGQTTASPWMTPTGVLGPVPPRSPLTAEALARWNGASRVADPVPVAASPLNCPFGLEGTGADPLAPSGGARSYEGLASVGRMGKTFATVVNGDKKRSALVTPRSSHPLAIPGVQPRARFLDDGAIVATSDWRSSGDAGVVVARVDRQGGARWTRPLGDPGEVHRDPRLATGDGRVLVAWRGPGQPSYAGELCWTTLEVATGRERSPQKTGCLPTIEGYPAVAIVGDKAMMAHHRRDPANISGRGKPELILGVDGKTRPLPLGTHHGGMDMAVVADREVGLVAEKDGEILWAKLAADGRLWRGPTVVSRGPNNRKARIAWGHGIFVVAWERIPGSRTFAVAVDRFGTASPVHEIFAGRDTSTVAVAPTPKGFVAVATERGGEVLAETLRCRKQASTRAPDRIALP